MKIYEVDNLKNAKDFWKWSIANREYLHLQENNDGKGFSCYWRYSGTGNAEKIKTDIKQMIGFLQDSLQHVV